MMPQDIGDGKCLEAEYDDLCAKVASHDIAHDLVGVVDQLQKDEVAVHQMSHRAGRVLGFPVAADPNAFLKNGWTLNL